MEARSIDVDGIRMRWIEHGDGMPVVLVHGIPTSAELWRRVMPRLAGVRALAWEMVGYGASIADGRGQDLSLAAQAAYLGRWMDAVGIDRAVLVGHDLGGGVVQIAGTRDPSICAGLVLINAVGLEYWPIPAIELIRRAGPRLGALPPQLARALYHALVRSKHDDPRVAAESAALHWRHYEASDGIAALVRQAQALDRGDTLAVASGLHRLAYVPSRVLWGTGDRALRVADGERLARALDTVLERLEGARHFVPEDHPDATARAIQAVVRRIGARPFAELGAARREQGAREPIGGDGPHGSARRGTTIAAG